MGTVRHSPRRKSVVIGKHTFEVYTIGFLAAATDLAVVTLRLWERQEVLPKPLVKIPGSMRYYTALEIQAYAGAIEAHYSSGRDKLKLRRSLGLLQVKCGTALRSFSSSDTTPPTSVLSLHLPPRNKLRV